MQQPPTPSAPPAYANHTPLQSPGFPPTNQSAQQQAAQIAGYSNYTYSSQQQTQPGPGQYNPQGAYSGDMHNQLYRPTQEEAAHGAQPGQRPQPQTQGSFSDKYRVTQRVDKVEKGVGKFLKKLDSKW